MKLISNFKDYYDPIAYQDTDDMHKYLRTYRKNYIEDEYIKVDQNIKDLLKRLIRDIDYYKCYRFNIPDKGDLTLRMEVLIYCGKIIPYGFILPYEWEYTRKPSYFYDIESLIKTVSNLLSIEPDLVRNYLNIGNISVGFGHYGTNFSLKLWNNYMSSFSNYNKEDILNLHKYYNSPVISLKSTSTDDCIEINPNLSDKQFQKVRNLYECYQDISTFVSNDMIINNEKPQVISDDVMRDKKGFDKWSFRKKKKVKV